MSDHVFEIEFPQKHSRHGKIVMDGVELRGVTDIRFQANVNSVVELVVTFLPEKVLARITDPDVTALVAQLIADTTSIPASNRTYTPAEAV